MWQYAHHVFRSYATPPVLAIGCIAYANGLPLLLTSTTLGIWLKSYGLNYLLIGLFGLLHLPYTFKFLWAPLLDQVPLPFFKSRLGQRRSWLFVVQITAIMGVWGMAYFDPLYNMKSFIVCGFLTAFSAASQHVLLLTYQMEMLKSEAWGIGEGIGILCYRLAILTSGAGALYIATYLEWQVVYLLISFLMLPGLIVVIFIKEPGHFSRQHIHHFSNWKEWIAYTFISPFKDFTSRKGWKDILIFMMCYRLPKNLSYMMIPLFLLDLGFSYIDIGHATKVFGLAATIMGGLLGGYGIRLYGYQKVLFWGEIAYGLSYSLFFIQYVLGANLPFLYLATGIEHFCCGITLTSFLAYQLTCCSITFAATQIALLTSLTALSHTLAPPLAGFLVKYGGWMPFITIVILSSLPGILWTRRIPFFRS